MADEKCRNCDAPLKGGRYCPECGADSKAKQFDRTKDVLAENERLRAENLELKKPKTPADPPIGGDDGNDI